MADRVVHTVLGPIPADRLGRTLVHEHLLVDFVGAAKISRNRYRREEAFATLLPYLAAFKEQGFDSFFECTPMYLGRDPELFRDLSRASGVQIVTNTGLYAAGQRTGEPEPFLPAYAYSLEAGELAGTWLKEWFEGIEGTAIKPGFIKIGVNPGGTLRPISEKIVRAAARTCRHSRLAVACHTGSGISALRILEILEEERVAPDKYIFVHAQSEPDALLRLRCAERGCWIELDGIGPDSAELHLGQLLELLEKGFENRVLLSQDAGWFRPGEPNGGAIRGFLYLWDRFVPMLRQNGVPEATIEHLLIHNPREAFSVEADSIG